MSTILGGRLCARCRRRIHVAGLLVAVFCSCAHISMPAPHRSLNNPTFSARKKLPDCIFPIFFFHHFDWNRWFASLATTVDNTIKMAKRSFKHDRQWCTTRVYRWQTKLTSVRSFSESHTSHGRARHPTRDRSESERRPLLPPGTSDSYWPRGVVTGHFRPFWAVCLTVFPFEFRPRTFTIGFYGKNLSYPIVRAYHFGVQFSFKAGPPWGYLWS